MAEQGTATIVRAGLDWSANRGPAAAANAAAGATLEPELAFLETEAAALDLEAMFQPTPPAPLGSTWRASRLLDLSDDAEAPERPAVIRVLKTDTGAGGLPAAGATLISDYSQFFLQSVNEQDMEKAHIVETFGTYWVHLFGRKPRVFSFSGTLLSTRGEDWEAAWDVLYDRYLRGTRLVELNAQAQLTYAGRSVYGYVLGSNKSKDSANEKSVPFSFSMLVTHVERVSGDQLVQRMFAPTGDGDELSLEETSAQAAAASGDEEMSTEERQAQVAACLKGELDAYNAQSDLAGLTQGALAADAARQKLIAAVARKMEENGYEGNAEDYADALISGDFG